MLARMCLPLPGCIRIPLVNNRIPGSGEVTYAELALWHFESHSNRALPARPGHRHARQVLSLGERARVLREAVHLLQLLLAGGTLLEGDFRWTYASLVPLEGLSQHGAHRAACVCMPARHAAARATTSTIMLGALDAPVVDP